MLKTIFRLRYISLLLKSQPISFIHNQNVSSVHHSYSWLAVLLLLSLLMVLPMMLLLLMLLLQLWTEMMLLFFVGELFLDGKAVVPAVQIPDDNLSGLELDNLKFKNSG